MHTKRVLAALLIILVCLAPNLFGQNPGESATLTRLFAEGPDTLSFTKQFSSAVPLVSMNQLLAQLTGQLGHFKQVEGNANPYTVAFEKGTVTAYISLDGQGRIAGLQFTQIVRNDGTLSDAVAQLISLNQQTSVLIRKNGEVLASHLPDVPLAVGSAFKLGVLAAVDDAIQAGRLRWDQSIALQDAWKSLPTGILQDWPAGSPVTVGTLASLMISVSDNTAADALIALVGRQQVQHYLLKNTPVLTTKEMFQLKNPDNADLLAKFRSGSVSVRERCLEELVGRPLPDPGLFSGDPVALDVEWFVNASALADLIERLQSLDLMTINGGLATKEHYKRVAFKGGAEPGVLNLTSYLVDAEQNRYTVVVTVNDAHKPLDEKKIMEIYQAILTYL
ncbi:MAG: serine hydrolase [Sphaerochaeta sp.]|jgi:beta-lactamase class A|uniref:serine hydrolase n=1 Tax=Sphaerochaeta sp. TaxID=1972642 RepID=UPI002FCC3AE5